MRSLAMAPLALLSGRMSWQATSLAPVALLSRDHPPAQLEITTADSPPMVLRRPELAGDSLRGWLRPDSLAMSTSPDAQQLIIVPLADVRWVRTKRFNPIRTIALVSGVGLTVIMVLAVREFSKGFSIRFPCGLPGEPCPQ